LFNFLQAVLAYPEGAENTLDKMAVKAKNDQMLFSIGRFWNGTWH